MAERDRRTQALWHLGDFGHGHGLEIGPLSRVVVAVEEGDVQYLDVRDRQGLIDWYAGDPGVFPERIPEIDFPLIVDGTARSLAEAAAPGAPFDWAIASHVVEHVPDLIGWLEEIAELVRDGGSLVLAVPDKRYCFDLHRPPTTVGAMIQAHDDRDDRPSVRAVYDYVHDAVSADPARLWKRHRPGFEDRLHSADHALTMVDQVRLGEYVDCHVWVFTSDLFLQQLHELRRNGLSAWYVDVMDPPHPGTDEFQVRLRRLARGSDTRAEKVEGELLSSESRPQWLAEGVEREARIRELQGTVLAQRKELAALRASASWRIGQAVVAPLGAVRRRLRRT
ncbi:MAG: SAM-dependent methyltransferase [Nocardioidaceae bacterium]|nr:SAM-dependent methyltransferase [Nocardioidaceae bacterium]